MFQHIDRDHLGGEFVTEEEDRQSVVTAALRHQDLFQHLPSGLCVLRAVDRDQPAGLVVEDFGKPPGVFVRQTRDYAEALFLDCGGQLLHPATSSALAFKVLIDDGDRKCLGPPHPVIPLMFEQNVDGRQALLSH